MRLKTCTQCHKRLSYGATLSTLKLPLYNVIRPITVMLIKLHVHFKPVEEKPRWTNGSCNKPILGVPALCCTLEVPLLAHMPV